MLGNNSRETKGHLTERMDFLCPSSLGCSWATFNFAESTHRSSPPLLFIIP